MPNGVTTFRPSHWLELHQYAVDRSVDWSPQDAAEFLREWSRRIPGHCDCNQKWSTYLADKPPRFESSDAFFAWSVAAHNHVSTNHCVPAKLPMTLADARRLYVRRDTSDLVQHVISWDRWTQDTLTLSQIILDQNPDVAGVAGVPRSGMRAACDVALRLGVPLYEASAAGLRYIGGGSRIQSEQIHGARRSFDGPIVIVDDSTCSGRAIKEVRSHPDLRDLPLYVVYAARPGRELVTGYAVRLELPHHFDWNLLHNGHILQHANVGIDFDGVLCPDCTAEDDDDGPRYAEWLRAVRPIRTPRDFRVPYIITARREPFRAITESWLTRYRINYGELVMFPGTFSERSRTCIGTWKAEQCERLGVGLFIESDLRQARIIAQIRRRNVISIERPSCSGHPA